MTVSRDQFTDLLVRSGLFSADDVAEFLTGLPVDSQPADGDALCSLLAERGRLTPLQVQALAKGETKGLVYGDYTILDRIGAGGMGQVFKGLHRRMKRAVAIKVLHGAHTETPTALKRFYREVEAAARLIHPNIVSAYDAGESHGTHYLVMELVEGQDLSHYLKSRGRLPVSEAVNLIAQAARGLEHAHALGICHRDIKLSNLLIDRFGTVKVLDMGIARLDATDSASGDAHTDGITQTNQLLGTVEYMAPEQGRNAKLADHRSDVYSLGCCLYRLLVGRAPYAGDSAFMTVMAHMKDPIPELRAERPDVPDDIEAIFQKMVAKRPEDRHQSMSEVIAALASSSVAASASIVAGATPAAAAQAASTASANMAAAAATGSSGAPDSQVSVAPIVPAMVLSSVAAEPPAGGSSTASSHGVDQATAPHASAPSPEQAADTLAVTSSPNVRLWAWRERAAPYIARGKTLGLQAAHGARYAWGEARSTAVVLAEKSRQWSVARRAEFLAKHPDWTEKKFNLLAGGACAFGLAIFAGLCVGLASLGGGSQPALANVSPVEPPPQIDPLAAELAALVDKRQPLALSKGTRLPELASQAPAADRADDVAMPPARTDLDDAPLLASNAELEPLPLDELRQHGVAAPTATEWSRADLSLPAPASSDELTAAVNLLQFVQLPRDVVFGEWRQVDDGLDVSHPPTPVGQPVSARPMSVLVRHMPTASFDLTILATRRAGSGPLLVSLPVAIGTPDGARSDKLTTLSVAAGRPTVAPQPQGGGFLRRFRPIAEEQPQQPPTGVAPTSNNQQVKIVFRVRPLGVAVEVDGKPLDAGAFAEPTLDRQFRHTEDRLFRLGALQSMWRIQQMSLTPVWNAEALPAGAIDLRQVAAMQQGLEPGVITDPVRPPPPRLPSEQGPKTIRDVLRETLEGELDEFGAPIRPGKLPAPKGLFPK